MLLLPGSQLKYLSLLTTFICFPPNSLAELHFYPTLARAAHLGYLVTSDPKSPGTLEAVFRLPHKTGDFLLYCLRSNLFARGEVQYVTF